MIEIGLTGSIGMGKSTAAGILQQLGVPVFDSDACVHHLLGNDKDAITKVIKYFPDVWDLKKRRIDRKALGKIVFHDIAERKRLEAILHPYVWEHQTKFRNDMHRSGFRMIAYDIPLLFETGAQNRLDVTICVTAPPYIQYQRVMARPGMTEDRFFSILEGQMPDPEKRAMADYVVPTGIGRGETFKHLSTIVDELRTGMDGYSRAKVK